MKRAIGRWMAGFAGALAVGGCGRDGDTADVAPATTPDIVSENAPRAAGPGVEGLMLAGDVEAALVRARADTIARPTDPQAFLGLASAALTTGRMDEALDAVRAAIRLAPERAGAYVLRGLVHQRRGDLAEAERSWQEALQRKATPEEARAARLQLAGLARDRGDLRGEAAVLKAAIEANPSDAAMRGALALCFAGLGEGGAAKAEALEAVRLDPKTPGVQRLLAALAWDDRDIRGALERAIIALRIDPADAVADKLLEGAFYIEVATRLGCEVGARPATGWPADTVIRVLKGIEQEYGIEGAATFVDLEARFGADPEVGARVQEAVDARCPKAP